MTRTGSSGWRAGILGAALGTFFLCGQSANAAVTLDFLAMANAGEQAVEQVPSLNPILNAYVPIATSAFGFNGSSGSTLDQMNASPYAYLDGNSAGLGVCQTVTTSRQCNPSNDDNVQNGEVLGLTWSQDIQVNSLYFRGENHPNDSFVASDTFAVSFDSGLSWVTMAMINAKVAPVFVFATVKAGDFLLLTTGAPNSEQFYLSAANITTVPLPAGMLLLGSAVAGFALIKRRTAA